MDRLQRIENGINSCLHEQGGAIFRINCNKCIYNKHGCFSSFIEDLRSLMDELTPVKPKTLHDNGTTAWHVCGNCGATVYKGISKYCSECGRRIEWDE